MKIRRALLSVLSDAAYDTVQSFHSDSAVCFSVFLHHLPDLTSQHPPHVLLRAIEVCSHLSWLTTLLWCLAMQCIPILLVNSKRPAARAQVAAYICAWREP